MIFTPTKAGYKFWLSRWISYEVIVNNSQQGLSLKFLQNLALYLPHKIS